MKTLANALKTISELRYAVAQLLYWATGDAHGGRDGDGRYTLTLPGGEPRLVPSPARLRAVDRDARVVVEAAESRCAEAHREAQDILERARAALRSANDAERRAHQHMKTAEAAQKEAERAASQTRSLTRKHFPGASLLRVPAKTSTRALRGQTAGILGWDEHYIYLCTENATKRVPLESY